MYKVKAGNNEFVIKGNVVGGIPSGGSATTQGKLIKTLANQAETTAAINDVILATKEGLLNYRCIIGNSDTSGIVMRDQCK